MLGIHDLPLFIVSGLLLNLTPGPDSVLIMSRSASGGWRAGMAAAWGIAAGCCVHVLAAALGLSALLATSATAFSIVKWIGAAYLCWLGLTMLLARGGTAASEQPALAPLRPGRIFLQGLLTNVLNPKVALFFLAFVPQFIAPEAPHKALAFLVLGAIFVCNGMLWCGFLAVFSAQASRRIAVDAGTLRWLNRGIGALFLSFGVKLALSEHSSPSA